jgi:hypothetical protein
VLNAGKDAALHQATFALQYVALQHDATTAMPITIAGIVREPERL